MQIQEADLLRLAREETRRYQQKYIRTEHLLLALLQLDTSLPIDYDSLAAQVAQLPFPTCGAEETLELANGARRALAAISRQEDNDSIDTENLMQTVINNSPLLRRILNEINTIDIIDSTEEG